MIRPQIIRGVYRLQQTIGMTPMEFRAALIFVTLLFAGILGQRWMERPIPIDPSSYAALESSFLGRAAELAKRAESDTTGSRATDSLGVVPSDPGIRPGDMDAPAAVTERPGRRETSPGPLDLNRATAEDLIALPRIGPAIAGRILAFRTRNGPFRYVDDLLMVRGIGEKTLDGLRALVRIGPAGTTPPPNDRSETVPAAHAPDSLHIPGA